MFDRMFISALGLAALALSGCGGATPGGGTVPSVNYADYAAMDAAMRAAHSSLPYTDPATLPGSGTASYSGVVALTAGTPSGPLDLNGALNVTANFGTSTISGQAGSFLDTANAAYSGTLALSNGLIDRGANPATQYSVTADMGGTLTGPVGALQITAPMSGDFLGNGHSAFQGGISGTATGPGGTDFLFGSFIATQ